MHIKHVALRVNNLDESIEFYETITELTVSRRFKADPGEVAFLSNGSDAFSLDQCRKLVDTYEETGVPCMLLENNCYPRPAMAVFNMIKKGLFGDIVHAEGAYCHFFAERQVKCLHTGTYRIPHYLHRNCDNYPCHGIALPFMALNINRGNRFVSLVSVATKSLGIRNATKSVFGENWTFCRSNGFVA